MEKIPDARIEQIKQASDLRQEVQSRGIELKRQGKEWIGLCPFHQEDTPSFSINEEKQVWHCFGCGKGGDVIKFVMEYDKKDFRDALASLNGSPHNQSVQKPKIIKSTKPPIDPSTKKYALQILDYYHHTLKNAPTALAYLQSRGLNHPELIDTFKIGYSNRSLSKILPGRHSKEGIAVRKALKAWGILSTRGYEHFGGCLTFPIFKANGELGEIYARRVVQQHRELPNHLYLPGPHQGIFNYQVIGHDSPLILCESIIDALTLWVHDFRHVTASFGAGGFIDEMLSYFKQREIKSIWIAYDNDEGGNHNANHLGEKLVKEGFQTERILLPKDIDLNEFTLAQESPKQALTEVLENRYSYNDQFTIQLAQSVEPSPKENNPALKTDFLWDGQLATVSYGDRHYRLRGLERNRSLDHLKVQIRIQHKESIFLDTLDLTSNKQRRTFVQAASEELGLMVDVIKKDLGKILMSTEMLVENLLNQQQKQDSIPQSVQILPEEREEALQFLKQKDLLDQILRDFEGIGLVGEATNKLIGYLVAISRKLDDPLAVIVQSSSSAGKTTLMDGILSFVPEEDQEKWTTLTGQSLYYVEEEQLKHKLIAVAEEEGVEKATYPLKILQSEKELKIATTVKDPKTGEFKVQNKHAEGPCAILLTTTAADVDEELINRFIRLTVDEDRSQTQAIHCQQRSAKTLQGLQNKVKEDALKKKHHNAQRLLKPIPILNPYADQLTFFTDCLRARRDHKKYLGLIEAITFLHKYQRPLKKAVINGKSLEYIEVSIEDIQIANQLINEVLGRCLDELAPQTRRLLGLIHEMIVEKCEEQNVAINEALFTRKTVRDYTHWSDSQLKCHMKRLEELEYVLIHQGGRGQIILYELIWDGEGQDGSRFIPGLIDPKELKSSTVMGEKSGVKSKSLGQVCPKFGPSLGGVWIGKSSECTVLTGLEKKWSENHQNSLLR